MGVAVELFVSAAGEIMLLISDVGNTMLFISEVDTCVAVSMFFVTTNSPSSLSLKSL